jgi:hypothetical protein
MSQMPGPVNEFNNMGALSDKYLKISANRDYLRADSINNEPLAQKLLACWQSLSSMASENQSAVDGSCQ